MRVDKYSYLAHTLKQNILLLCVYRPVDHGIGTISAMLKTQTLPPGKFPVLMMMVPIQDRTFRGLNADRDGVSPVIRHLSRGGGYLTVKREIAWSLTRLTGTTQHVRPHR